MKNIILALLLIVLIGCANKPWNKKEKVNAAMFTGLAIIDWGQTRDIVDKMYDDCVYSSDGTWHCKYSHYERTNFMLGKKPTIGKVDTYFPVAIGTILTISHYLPKWRSNILKGAATVELGIVYGNYQIGLNVNF